MRWAALWLAVLALAARAACAGEVGEAAPQILVTFKQPQTVAPPRTGARSKYFSGDSSYSTSLKVSREVRAVARAHGLREVDAWPIVPLGVHCVVFELAGDRAPTDVLTELSADPRVESAQPMQLFDVLASEMRAESMGVALSGRGYDDPYLNLQHSARELQLEAAQRWASGRGVDVAVIDTGVDARHPELAGRIALTQDFVDPPARGGEQHGTAVAGIIAADAGNGIGIIGVAPDVKLLALRACWPEAGGKSVCSSFTLAKALTFALERAPQIINLSLAGPQDPLLERLLRLVLARGIIVVAACRGADCDSFPASIPQVIAVSNVELPFAAPAGGAARVAPLRAPGVDVITTMPHRAFDFVSGSSIAAAHVTGIIALLLQRRPDLNATSLRQALALSVRTAGGAAGSVNACEALASLLDGAGCPSVDTIAGRG